MADLQDVVKVFSVMSLAWPNYKAKPGTIDVYASVLTDIPADVLQVAGKQLIASGGEFFPSASLLRTTALSMMSGRQSSISAYEAWEEVQQQVALCGDYYRYTRGICNKVPVWSSPVVEKAVKSVGYMRICETDNEDVVRAHFFKAYDGLVRRWEDETKMLPESRAIETKYQLDAPSVVRRLAERKSV
jgi:hypothetical protein